MSGHSKWHSIKHKKGAADAARGKVFTRHAKLIQICAKQGSDPELNPTLRTAIDNAKAANVPNANIERAIKKGSGELKDGSIMEELTYDAYGPAGIALLINCITDNRNRTVSSIKSILGKSNGNLGENGSVSWMFKRKGLIEIDIKNKDQEELELQIIDAGAEDIEVNGTLMTAFCTVETYLEVKNNLEKIGVPVLKAYLRQIPDNTILINDKNTANKILKLIEKLEEDEDVDEVASNFDFSDEVLKDLSQEL